MSVKRTTGSMRSSFGGSDSGAKVGRQELFDQLKKLAANNQAFTPVDIALNIGAGEPQVSKALLGLAAEGLLSKLEAGRYQVAEGFDDIGPGEFIKAFARASRPDSGRTKDLSEITRLKQNNDIMRSKLLAAIAERDHYRAALAKHGIDPGPPPAPPAVATPPPPPDGAASAEGEPTAEA